MEILSHAKTFHCYGGSQEFNLLKNQNLIDSTRVARWMDFLPQFDFDIRYLQGKNNSAADALSRYPYNHENNLTLAKIKLALLELT